MKYTMIDIYVKRGWGPCSWTVHFWFHNQNDSITDSKIKPAGQKLRVIHEMEQIKCQEQAVACEDPV